MEVNEEEKTGEEMQQMLQLEVMEYSREEVK